MAQRCLDSRPPDVAKAKMSSATDTVKTTGWFEDEGCPPPPKLQALAQSHDDFRSWARGAVGATEIPSSEQSAQHKVDKVAAGLQRRLSAMQNFRQLSSMQKTHVSDREKGAKRVGRLAQEATNGLAEFVNKYSKFIEMVFGAGGIYGTVAYETLSILLAIIVNKVRNDKRVTDMLDLLRESLPRLDTWELIYPTETMKGLVADVYSQTIVFYRLAAKYLASTRNRILLAVFPVFANSFESNALDIQKTLADINSEALFRLHTRSHEIKQHAEKSEANTTELLKLNNELLVKSEEAERQREKVALQNEQLRRQLAAMIEEDDGRRLSSFQNQELEFGDKHTGDDFIAAHGAAATRLALMEVFKDVACNPRLVPSTAYIQMSREFLQEKCPEYAQWLQAETSSLLFVSGATCAEGRRRKGYQHSWLSPLSIYAARDVALDEKKEQNLVFFSCLPDLEERRECSGATMLSSIILQILRRKPDMLRSHDHSFRALKRRNRPINPKGMNSVEPFLELLEDVLRVYATTMDSQRTMHIVIDRLDLCVDVRVPYLLQKFARIIDLFNSSNEKPNGLRVKILVVAHTSRVDPWWKSWLADEQPEVLQFHYDQARWSPGSIARKRPRTWGEDFRLESDTS